MDYNSFRQSFEQISLAELQLTKSRQSVLTLEHNQTISEALKVF